MASVSETIGGYCDVCREAAVDDAVFSSFKQNGSYRIVLEHLDRGSAEKYYSEIKNKKILESFDLFKKNDTLGSPEIHDFSFGNFSPTTVRYAKVLDDIFYLDLNDKKIIEIGCGYGGQYTVLRQVAKPKSYAFADLDIVIPLIQRYVEAQNLNDIDLSFLNEHSPIEKFEDEYDLVISNYSISECDTMVQDFYIDNVIKKSKHGYVTFNHLRGYSIESFCKKLSEAGKNYRVRDEVPQTGDNNVIVEW